MVKLKIQARVLTDSDYAQSTTSNPVPIRKFIVIVRNPEDWYVGTLAHEVSRTYQRLYKQPLGQVQSLKDGHDCDLDPEQLVSDVFLDEGKAAQDGYDQEAVFTVIHEKGQQLRSASIAPDLSLPHYHTRPRPSPRFPVVPSSLGKRTYSITDESTPVTEKRQKPAEIPETQDDPAPTIERSPELVKRVQADDDEDEEEEDDVFDDAAESQENDKGNVKYPKISQFPRTPSSSLVPNGQGSSMASKFKSSRKDTYAAPESDIEDSQMSPPKNGARENQNEDMKTIEAKSSQQSQKNNDASNFNAQEALLPKSPTPAPQSRQQNVASLLNGFNHGPEASESDIGMSSDSDSAKPAQLKLSKVRKTNSPAKEKPTALVASKQAVEPEVSKSSATRKRKLGESQKETLQRSTATSKENKKQKAGKPVNSNLELPSSPSRRTSGVVSELDSPSEQLSQSLWDTAKKGSLAENTKNALITRKHVDADSEKPTSQTLKNRRRKESRRETSSSASTSRPGSSAGTSQSDNPNAIPVKPGALAEKIKAAKVKSESATASAAVKKKESATKKTEKVEESKSTTPATKPTLPAPQVASEPKDPKTPATVVRSTFIIPPGWTEEQYLARRAQHEATPQPAKPAKQQKKKEATPVPTESKTASATNVKQEKLSPEDTKKVAIAASENAPKKTPPQTSEKKATASKAKESSSESEESSSDESSADEKQSNKKSAQANNSSKSASETRPSETQKSSEKASSKDKDKESMPPPSPKSTAKRRESTSKKSVERLSTSASAETSSESSSDESSNGQSTAPATTPTATKAKPASTTAKKTTSTSSAAAAVKHPEKPISRLKQLREKFDPDSASNKGSPAPTPKAKKKPPPPPSDSSSSSSDDSDSSSSDSDDKKKQKKHKKVVKKVPKVPDRSIRDVTPDSGDESGDE